MTAIRSILASAALVGAFSLTVTGCLGRSPSVQFFTLRAVDASKAPLGTGAAEGLAVGVGPVSLPRYLDRPQLARRSGESSIAYDEYSRWAGPLDAELLRVLGTNLSALLASERVVVYPAAPAFPLAYRVTLDVQRFDVGRDNAVKLRARWTILSGSPGEAVKVGRTDVEQSARSGNAADVVASHSAVAGVLSRAIADDLRGLSRPTEAP